MKKDKAMTIESWLNSKAQHNKNIMKKRDVNLSKDVIVVSTLLALSVEVSELANEVNSFKYWSNKPPSNKEIILEEFSDVLHILGSLADYLGFTPEEVIEAYEKKDSIIKSRLEGDY